jgi:hypothetical protein
MSLERGLDARALYDQKNLLDSSSSLVGVWISPNPASPQLPGLDALAVDGREAGGENNGNNGDNPETGSFTIR